MTIHLQGAEFKPTSGKVRHIVLLLHGLGADGDDLIGLAPMLAASLPDTYFYAPNAPYPCDMAPYGYQWFSLQSRNHDLLEAGVRGVMPILNDMIDALLKRFKLADKDLAIVGFSQGTMTGLYTALRRTQAIAGMVGFSGALLGADTLAREIKSHPPLCLIHGEEDMVVPFVAMTLASEVLGKMQLPLETHARPGLGHGIDPEGIALALPFLRKCLGL